MVILVHISEFMLQIRKWSTCYGFHAGPILLSTPLPKIHHVDVNFYSAVPWSHTDVLSSECNYITMPDLAGVTPIPAAIASKEVCLLRIQLFALLIPLLPP